MSEKRDYLGMFNVLKGILLLVIVWIHHESFARGTLLGRETMFPEMFRWSAGVMALFFVMAGYQYRFEKDLTVYIKKQLSSLLIPYGIALAIVTVFLFLWHIISPNNIHLWDIRMFLLGGIYGTEKNVEIMGIWLGGAGPLWFLPTFCFGGILFQCLQRIKKRNYRMIAIWGLTVLAVSFPNNIKLALPLFCVQTCSIMGFMEIGRELRARKILYQKFSPVFVFVTIAAAIGCHLFSVSNIAANIWKYWMVDYMIAAALCCVILRGYVKSGIGAARGTGGLEYIGMYSIIFYCVHSVEYFAILWDRRTLEILDVSINNLALPVWTLVGVTYILRVGVLVALTVLINIIMKRIYHFRVKKHLGGIK